MGPDCRKFFPTPGSGEIPEHMVTERPNHEAQTVGRPSPAQAQLELVDLGKNPPEEWKQDCWGDGAGGWCGEGSPTAQEAPCSPAVLGGGQRPLGLVLPPAVWPTFSVQPVLHLLIRGLCAHRKRAPGRPAPKTSDNMCGMHSVWQMGPQVGHPVGTMVGMIASRQEEAWPFCRAQTALPVPLRPSHP